ncbi:hypothetical protein D3C72_1399240 [compost metagenome]
MIEIKDIVKALEASWGPDTAFDKDDWTIENSARGQCVISSLVVQDYFGGELLKYSVEGEGLHESHYFNQLPDGTIIDTTKKQYTHHISLTRKPVSFEGFASIREKRLSDNDTRLRYELLKNRVSSYLKS